MVQLLLFVVVLTLTRIIKSVVTEQAPVTLELRNTHSMLDQGYGIGRGMLRWCYDIGYSMLDQDTV